MPVIQASGLCVHYGNHCALHNLDLSVTRGHFVGIVGPNGGGKSTLLRALLGLLPSAQGSLGIDGHVAYVPQDAIRDDPHIPISVQEFTVLGRLGPRLVGRPTATDRGRVRDALEEAGVWDLRDRRLSRLSGGQRQRVHLARALCSDADILLLDEPTSGVDPSSRDEIHRLLRHLADDHQHTILMVSHDTESLVRLADRIVVIDQTKRFEGDGDAYRRWNAPRQAPEPGNPFGAHAEAP